MEQPVSHTFTIQERLKSRRIIGQLFAGGAAFLSYPVRVVWCYFPDNFDPMPTAQVQVMVAVPKKNFKRAHDRNRIKRLVREAWRLQKHLLYAKLPTDGRPVAVLLMYIGKEEVEYQKVHSGVGKAIRQLTTALLAPTT